MCGAVVCNTIHGLEIMYHIVRSKFCFRLCPITRNSTPDRQPSSVVLYERESACLIKDTE